MNSCFVRLAGRSGALAVLAFTAAHGQVVTPKTVPVHQEDQFAIFPSMRAGMGDVSIALDDTLADAFANPAKATRVRGGSMFVAPFTHGVSAGVGGGRTLPVGGVGTIGDWSAAAVFAVQTLRDGVGPAISDRMAANQYGSVTVARRFGNGLSVGASAYAAGLNAVDDVNLLYAGSDHIGQSGTLTDFRLGMTKEWGARRLELLLVNSHTSLTQDVHYTSYFYPPAGGVYTTERLDHNLDHTNIWSAHTSYSQPIGADGWHVGWLATASRLSHPQIPNYQIQNIPRDPGTTYGYNIGVGAARAFGATSFGIDVIEEPMFSNTYGTAASDTALVGGGVLSAGEKTISNHFNFSNAKIRIGLGRDIATSADSSQALGLQLGLIAYSINYRLRQTNHVLGTERIDDEGWTEWTPTFGLRWRTKDFELQYTFRFTCGPSDCVPDIGSGDRVTVPPATTGGIIAAPASPLTIDGGRSHVHKIMMSVPIH